MFHSLAAFAALPGRTRVYCGHEYTEANARFAVHADPTNAALRARAEAVRQLRAAGKPTVPSLLSDEMAENPFMRAGTVEALAALRSAKDTF
jgi:hydroxyacylglutathione hydrolase